MKRDLSSKELACLRTAGHLTSNEIALVEGDLLVAEDVLTRTRRIVEGGVSLLENKQLLKD